MPEKALIFGLSEGGKHIATFGTNFAVQLIASVGGALLAKTVAKNISNPDNKQYAGMTVGAACTSAGIVISKILTSAINAAN